MDEVSAKICYTLQCCYDRGTNVAQAHKKKCAACGQDQLSEEADQRWLWKEMLATMADQLGKKSLGNYCES